MGGFDRLLPQENEPHVPGPVQAQMGAGTMRLLRVGAYGHERPVVLDDEGRSFDISPLAADLDGEFFASGGTERVRRSLEAGTLPEVSTEGLRTGAPVARPSAIICIGQNYAAHAAESGQAPPTEPVIFFKHPSTLVGPFDPVTIPPGSTRTDWEVELAVVIGRRCRYLASQDEAMAHVAGFAVANDVSEMELQLDRSGGQWSKGKSCETFNPMGPWLVPAEDVADPQALRLRSFVNGEARQDSTTADMIFGVAHLVWYLSQCMVLEPGDVVNTGTPAGVALSGRFPYLGPGDVMAMEIEGLGRQEQRLVAAGTPGGLLQGNSGT